MTPLWGRQVRMVLPVALLSLAIGACGADGEEQETGAADREAAADVVTIEDFKFAPAEIEVDAGTTVRWPNRDEASHTATSDESGVFDTGTIRTGEAKTVTLSERGTIAYRCDLHPFMKGKITVK